jgi:hypothetical protein
MKLEDLIEIKSEIKRFSDTVDEAITVAKATTGYVSSYDGMVLGKLDISRTRMSGAVKRRAMDLRYYLTKKL